MIYNYKNDEIGVIIFLVAVENQMSIFYSGTGIIIIHRRVSLFYMKLYP